MPFDLGIFFGARYLGDKTQHLKNALVFEKTRFTYQQFISDLNGIDPKAHNSDPLTAIQLVCNWLRTASGRKTIPGYAMVRSEYEEFIQRLASIVAALGFDTNNVPLVEYRTIVEEAVREKLAEKKQLPKK